MTRDQSFIEWIREEAALIHADGCTGVTNLYGICCLQHDLEFYYAKSAVEAYRRYRARLFGVWRHAESVTFEQANDHMKRCMFRESRFGHWNPVAWIRYAVIRRTKGRAAWDRHRAREIADAEARDVSGVPIDGP